MRSATSKPRLHVDRHEHRSSLTTLGTRAYLQHSSPPTLELTRDEILLSRLGRPRPAGARLEHADPAAIFFCGGRRSFHQEDSQQASCSTVVR